MLREVAHDQAIYRVLNPVQKLYRVLYPVQKNANEAIKKKKLAIQRMLCEEMTDRAIETEKTQRPEPFSA